ncbi:unnamed protein product [Closterium sp. NIES-64]|nr:unnamed protein product [Closterium sp. NIES-64]
MAGIEDRREAAEKYSDALFVAVEEQYDLLVQAAAEKYRDALFAAVEEQYDLLVQAVQEKGLEASTDKVQLEQTWL